MGDVINLQDRRAAVSWTVKEALEHALKMTEASDHYDKVYIAFCKKEPSKDADISYVMAGMECPEAMGWLFAHLNFLASDHD